MRTIIQQKNPNDQAWWASLQTAPSAVPEMADKCNPVLRDASGQPIETRQGWEIRRNQIQSKWLQYLGEIPRPATPPKYQVLESDTRDGVLRELVQYEAEPGLPVEGYLLKPLNTTGKRPAVIVLHSTVDHTIRQPAGLEGPEDKWIGLRLAQSVQDAVRRPKGRGSSGFITRSQPPSEWFRRAFSGSEGGALSGCI